VIDAVEQGKRWSKWYLVPKTTKNCAIVSSSYCVAK